MGESITEHKQMEWALRENEEKYRELAESITDVFFAMDGDLRYTYWNKASEELTGIKAEDALGKSIFEIFPDREDTRKAVAIYQKVLKTQQPQSFVNEYQLGGKDFVFEISAYPTRSGLSVFVKDSTKHKKAEQEIKESEVRFRKLFDNMGSGGLVYKVIDNGKDFIIKDFNKAGEKIANLKKKDIIGKSVFQVFPGVEGMGLIDMFKKVWKTGKSSRYPITKYKDERITLWVENYVYKLPTDEIVAVVDDITERKRAEKVLRESEQKHRRLFEETTDAIFIADAETGILIDCNRAASELVGREKSELVGKHQQILHPPQELEGGFSRSFKQHIAEKEGQVLEAQVIAKNGEIKDVAIRASLVELKGKKCIQGMFRDITERKKAETALRTSEQKFRDLIETTTDWVWEVDAQGVYTYASPKIKDLLGYEVSEVLGKTPFDLMPEEEAERIGKFFNEKAINKEPFYSLENVNRHKDGHLVVLETNGIPIFDEKGQLKGYRGIDRNITERKKAEEEIIRTKEYLQNIIDSASEIIISFDTNNRVTTWNNTAEFITGYKQRGIIERQIHKLNVFDNPSEIADYIKSVRDGHKTKFDELILRTKDGAKRIIRVSSSAITDDKGHCNGILFIGKDITHNRDVHGRLLKGNSYLIVDKNNRSALDLFVDLTKSDYNGLFITRANPEIIKDMLSSTDIQILLLNQDKLGGFEHISDFDGLIAAVKDFSTENTDSVILLDRIDYLITRFSFERFTESLYQINSVISKNNSILLVYLNPSFLDTRQMAFIEAELQPLPGQKIEGIEIEDELFDILSFIYEQNQNNSLVSFKKISREFSIVRSTAAKRLRMLEDTGLVFIKKQGKLKTARISDKGKTLLNKRQVV